MGLSGNNKRSKLSHDPNNTAWSKATDTFGHRILSSQGWKPGDYLGADNANHADHYTAANASHIRVMLREDNLGIGAKVGGKGNAETFGLSTLSGIFGRLNGKTEVEVQKQQSGLRDAELRTYQAVKYGTMNFVSGGLLVGDKIEELPQKKLSANTVDAQSVGIEGNAKARVKRKTMADVNVEEAAEEKQLKRQKRKSDLSAEVQTATSPDSDVERTRTAVVAIADGGVVVVVPSTIDEEKAAKRRRKDERRAARATQAGQVNCGDEKARLKADKRARKEDRRKRKEERQRKRAAKACNGAEPKSDTTSGTSTARATPSASELPSGVSTLNQASSMFAGSRHAVRQRYITQKRMASMDAKALNEILMIKAQS